MHETVLITGTSSGIDNLTAQCDKFSMSAGNKEADPQVVVAGVQVPSAMVKQIADSLVKPVPLGLPQGIRATRVTAATEGLLIDLSGTDVDVTALR